MSKFFFLNKGKEVYCPNVTGQARISTLNSKSKRGELPLTLKTIMKIMVEDDVFSSEGPVDTGARVNKIRRGVIPENLLKKNSHPLTLWERMIQNLRMEIFFIRGTCTLEGKAVVGQQPMKIQCALHIYEADISIRAILSFKYLADQI